MPDRYKNNNGSEKHMKNTDNEDTMYIPNSPDIQKYSAGNDNYNRQQNYNNPAQNNQQINPQYYQQQYRNRYPQQFPNVNQQRYPDGQYPQMQQQNPFAQQYAANHGHAQQQYPDNGQPQYNSGYYQQQYNNTQGQQFSANQNNAHYEVPKQPPRSNNSSQQKPKRKKKKKKNLIVRVVRRILLTLLIIFLLLFGIYSCTSLSIINKFDTVKSEARQRTSGALDVGHVTSVLIIGTDGRTDSDNGRSDSIILLSLNKSTNELYLTSFMRDSYVEIPGRGWDKLNSAYAYGGADLLMDTIERNFFIRIDDYVSVNFNTVSSIIDSMDGLTLDISNEEAEAINVILISELNELMGDDKNADLLDGGGKLHLNGKQVLAYSRIRNVGNNDFERTERQRVVISKLIEKASSSGISFIKNLTGTVIPALTTNMSKSDLYFLSLRLPFIISYDKKQLRIPADGTFTDDPYNSVGWVINVDFEANYDILRESVFAEK